ncbi:MAG: SurA N-terminal domain-containing protein [Candidatus Omnitrophota bacterium]
MLKIFRQYTKVIIWIVVGSFILWGGYSVSALKKEGRFAGEAFGQAVTFQEYNQFYRATQLFMPAEKPIDEPQLLRDYTWQNIIYAREAKRRGIKIADEEVRGEIANLLKQQGLVSPTTEQYKLWLTRTLHLSPREFEEGLREFIRIQKLLRLQIASFVPAGADKLTDPKAKEEAATKQKMAFIAWTNDVNKRAALKDYLALQGARQEEPLPEEVEPPQTESPAAKK